MAHKKLTIRQVNHLTANEFVSLFGGVIENSSGVALRAWSGHPFGSARDVHRAMCAVVDGFDREGKEALIRAHPDLVGKAALAGALAPESTREQASAGLDHLTEAEIARFAKLNRLYRGKFGFPFVICARENKKESILAGMEARLTNSREEEIATALAEIQKIAWLRLLDIITGIQED